MKRYCKDFVFTVEYIKKQIEKCLDGNGGKHRWNRRDTSYFLAEYAIKTGYSSETDIDKLAHHMFGCAIVNHLDYKYDLVPLIAIEMFNEIENETITLNPIIYQERIDGSSGKVRKIGITSIKQQVLDYIVVGAIEEMLMAKIGVFQCSSIKNRGQTYAKKYIEKFIRKKLKTSRYIGKFDIYHCYNSIRHDLLLKKLNRDIKNSKIMYLLNLLISSYGENGVGLCIGTFLSQYLANYYLSYLYHEITENMYKFRKTRGKQVRVNLVHHVIFYMDDVALFCSNKKDLKKAMKLIAKYLDKELGLRMKHDGYQVIDMYKKGAFLDMVGYKFYRRKTAIRKRIYIRATRTLRSINRNKVYNTKVIKRFMSYHGYFKRTDCYKIMSKGYIKFFRLLKEVLSFEARNSVYRPSASGAI